MELTQAIDILQRLAASKQEELDAIRLSISILQGDFHPELNTIENARVELKASRDELAQVKDDLISVTAERDSLKNPVEQAEQIKV